MARRAIVLEAKGGQEPLLGRTIRYAFRGAERFIWRIVETLAEDSSRSQLILGRAGEDAAARTDPMMGGPGRDGVS